MTKALRALYESDDWFYLKRSQSQLSEAEIAAGVASAEIAISPNGLWLEATDAGLAAMSAAKEASRKPEKPRRGPRDASYEELLHRAEVGLELYQACKPEIGADARREIKKQAWRLVRPLYEIDCPAPRYEAQRRKLQTTLLEYE